MAIIRPGIFRCARRLHWPESGERHDRVCTALTASGPATILLTQGEFAITEALTIDGPGSDFLTIDAQLQSRILDITATAGDFLICGLTLMRGPHDHRQLAEFLDD